MKTLNLFGKTFFRKGYLELSEVNLLPRTLNEIYNVDPNLMDKKQVENIFGQVIRGLDYVNN
ncbi:hypothetical protein CMO86_00320 [Candidatus Woesearchaeota archaeon]|jgi:hypothetical protein|nr:hypothetical protein [Candidatus Woesearchaeota archaeon]|tara:strand:+ start:728 stop:913 length:186 start_codon:yes stop_codon:yes gene_type:complete